MTDIESEFRDAKARLNAVAERLLDGDRTVVGEADEAMAAIARIRQQMTAASEGVSNGKV